MVSFFLVLAAITTDQSPYPAYLDTATTGALAFRKAHPERDGRGVAIAVLDTGVDMGVPGLDRLPDGRPKVVEARDFTGESVVECVRPTVEKDEHGEEVLRAKGAWVKGAKAIQGRKADAPVFLGALEEARFKDTLVSDLNGNGRTDDVFAVLVFKDQAGEWEVVVDRDADHDVASEKAVRSYEKAQEWFALSGYDASRGTAPVHMAVHVTEGEGVVRVEFHIPSGTHGTHVAGIAAGFSLNGQAGYDGVAPGAVVLSLKIGNNALAGGASVTDSMRKAFEFAAQWGREHQMPVVVNLSYGIGSEAEGEADIDRWLDRFAVENPHCVIVTSGGNQGPGLSTVGSPAAAAHVIAVGAAYGPDQAKDLLGAQIGGVRLFQFSARGGEVAKPDVVAPGIAASTVPPYSPKDVMYGTSMAAPQVAGAAALLLSGRTRPFCSGMVKRAMGDGARPLKGYTALDQGAGLLDVQRAASLFDAMPDSEAFFMGIAVQTLATTMPYGKARAAYFRAGGYAPDALRPARVTIRPVFVADASGQDKSRFYKSFSLSADAGWVSLSRRNVYLKGEGEATFDLYVDRAKVSGPGVHVATVTGRSDSVRFSFPVTVVTPYPVRDRNGIPTLDLRGLSLEPSQVMRIPISPPPGTATMEVRAVAARDRYANAYVYLFDARGRQVPMGSQLVASERNASAYAVLEPADITNLGTLELVLYAFPTGQATSVLDLEVRFIAFNAVPVTTLTLEPGGLPSATLPILNQLGVPFVGRAEGQIAGCSRTFEKKLGQDRLREGLHLSMEMEAVEVELALSPEDYGRFTDIAVTVTGKSGKLLEKTAFQSRVLRFTISNPEPTQRETDVTMEVVGGFAQGGGKPANLKCTLRYRWKDPVKLTGSLFGDQRLTLYPTVPAVVDLKALRIPLACPKGDVWFGAVEFQGEQDGRVWFRVPVQAVQP